MFSSKKIVEKLSTSTKSFLEALKAKLNEVVSEIESFGFNVEIEEKEALDMAEKDFEEVEEEKKRLATNC